MHTRIHTYTHTHTRTHTHAHTHTHTLTCVQQTNNYAPGCSDAAAAAAQRSSSQFGRRWSNTGTRGGEGPGGGRGRMRSEKCPDERL